MSPEIKKVSKVIIPYFQISNDRYKSHINWLSLLYHSFISTVFKLKLIFISVLMLVVVQSEIVKAGKPIGPLKVSTINSRYFTDGSGRAILLTGSHTWDNLQDITKENDNHIFNFTAYLDWLKDYNHNFIRMWAWEQSKWHPRMTSGFLFSPNVYMRTGPGNALDGSPKFNVNKFNQPYFDRLRARVIEAGERGIYVSVMLFEGWSIEAKGADEENPWYGHPFHSENNVNDINGDIDEDNKGKETHSMSDNPKIKAVRELQENYVKKVIDTLNDLDNVMWEISNESHRNSEQWHYHIINFIKNYEKNHKPKQHPVWMTVEWELGNNKQNNADVFNSPADAVSLNSEGGYRDNPPQGDGSKVIIADTDHLWGVGGNKEWVWKSFLRGLNPLFMDPYDSYYYNAYGHNDKPFDPKWEPIRKSMGYVRTYADKMNLTYMIPHSELASTSYCLANPGSEYLVYQPSSDSAFTVNLAAGTYSFEWFNPGSGSIEGSGRMTMENGNHSFKAPFSGDAVLYIKAEFN